MKTALVLFLAASPALAGDWQSADRIDPMTDAKVCTITSPSVKLGVAVRGPDVMFVSSSKLPYDYLTVRVDDNKAVMLGERSRSTGSYDSDARDLLGEIRAGKRLRVQYRDVDGTVDGDGEVCNLPALIDACR
jgi:hypothetical protein